MINMRELVKPNEQVLWEGKPKKSTTILEGIFNPMLFFALIWGAFDMGFMGVAMTADGFEDGILMFLVPFMLIHMMPVWIYIAGVFGVFFRWKNTHFMVTTQALYISGGLFAFNYEMKPWVDIGHITIHQGIFDRMTGVGDVNFVCNHTHMTRTEGGHNQGHGMKIYNIPDFKEVFSLVNNLQTDMYSDTMFPNAMRPETNPGYNTQYTGMNR